jgi:hypothetical protein
VEVVGHECNIRRLDRRIRADRPHGDAVMRPCHGRRVVHTVPDHRHHGVARHQFLDGGHLVLRQQLCPDLVDPDFGRHRPCRELVVAGQHDDGLHALRVEPGDDVLGIGPDPIAQFQDTDHARLVANGNQRPARTFDPVPEHAGYRGSEALFGREAVGAEPDRPAACPSL